MNVKLRPASKRETLDYFGTVMEEEVGCFPVPPPVSPLRIRQNGKAVRIPRPTVVIDSQEHIRKNDPAPTRRKNEEQGYGQAREPTGDKNALTSNAIRESSCQQIGECLDDAETDEER